MNILKNVQKIPGGLMIVPMLITALINTIVPGALRIGNPTTAVFTSTGTMTVIGIILFIAGTQLKFNQLGNALKRGGVFCLLKIIIGFATSLIVFSICGEKGFLGMSALALVIGMASCNPGVYMALVQQYGDDVDIAAFGLLNIVAVPALPIAILSFSTTGAIDYMSVVATLVPFIVGMILANIDPKISALMGPGTPICLVFLGFCFGSNINLINAVKAGPSGILLSLLFLIINIPIFLAVDRFILKRPGYAGTAFSCVAGISAAVPMIIASIMPSFAPYAEAATAQMALAVVITSFTVPFITKYVVNKYGTGKEAVPAKA